jgi:endoplasmic reticulum-Golgi intermediate compartment protein 1
MNPFCWSYAFTDLGIDIQDDLGRHEVGFIDDTAKIDINEGEGCRMKTKFKVNKVPGNFHVSTHASQEQPLHPSMA